MLGVSTVTPEQYVTPQPQPYFISPFSEKGPSEVLNPGAMAEKALLFSASGLLGQLSAGQAGFRFDCLP